MSGHVECDLLIRVLLSSTATNQAGRTDMGDIENKAEELKGAAKQHFGDATDNEDLEAEGAAEKAKAEVKQAGENVKDAVKDTFDR